MNLLFHSWYSFCSLWDRLVRARRWSHIASLLGADMGRLVRRARILSHNFVRSFEISDSDKYALPLVSTLDIDSRCIDNGSSSL